MFRALTSGDLRGLSTGLFLFYFLLVLFFLFPVYFLSRIEKSPDEW